jgi:hypothetical protein
MKPTLTISQAFQPVVDWESWSTVTIQGFEFLGSIKGNLLTRVDVKAHASGQGSQLTPRGRKPSEIDITLRLYRTGDLLNLEQLLPVLRRLSDAATPQAVTISHPALKMCGLSALFCRGNSIPQFSSAKNEGSVTLKFVEFAAGSGASGATKGVAPTNDEVEAKQAGLKAFLAEPQPVMSALPDLNVPTGMKKMLEQSGIKPTPPSFTAPKTTK